MKNITLLCGKSGSGKDYISQALDLKLICTHTTRPKRSYEINGFHKWFHMIDEIPHFTAWNIVAHTKRGKYYYWTWLEDLKSGDVYIIDIPGIKAILNHEYASYHFKFKVVYLDCPLHKRIINMLKRGEKVIDIINRLYIEYKDFKPIKNIKHTRIKL